MKASAIERRVLILGAVPLSLSLLSCDEKDTCEAPALDSLDNEDRERRQTVQYVDRTTSQERTCSKCSYFKAGQGCGTCTVLPGPIAPQGTCTLFRSAG